VTVDEPTPEPVAVRGAICNPIAQHPSTLAPLAVAERGTTRSPSATEVPIPDAVAVRMATSTVVLMTNLTLTLWQYGELSVDLSPIVYLFLMRKRYVQLRP
jgi:hypothetical protein